MSQTVLSFILIIDLSQYYCGPYPCSVHCIVSFAVILLLTLFPIHKPFFPHKTLQAALLVWIELFWVMRVTCSIFVFNCIRCVFVSDSLLWGSKLFDVEPATTQVCKWTLLEAEYVSMLYARWSLCQRMNWVCTLARNVSTEAQWTLVLSCHQSSDASLIARSTSPCSSSCDLLFSTPAPFHAFGPSRFSKHSRHLQLNEHDCLTFIVA